MLIFLFVLHVSAEVKEIKAFDIEGFLKESEKFKAIAFCDLSLDPCNFFFNSTRPHFESLDCPVAFVDIRSKEEADIAMKYDLSDFPYIIYFKPLQKHKPYTGSLEPIEISTFLCRASKGPPVYTSLETLFNDLDTSYYSDGLILSINQEHFSEVSDRLEPFFPFASTDSLEIKSKFECEAGYIVFRPKILNSHDYYTVVQGQVKPKELIDAFYKGLMFLTPNNHIWLKKELALVILYAKFSPKDDPAMAKYLIRRYDMATEKYNKEFVIAIAKIDDFKWVLEEIGLGQYTSIVLVDNTDKLFVEGEVLNESGGLLSEKVGVFLQNVKDKKAEPYIISEELPAKEYDNGVKVLVGKTINREIETLNDDMILLVYSVYDQDIKIVLYFIESLAKKFKDLKFGKIEANRNFVPKEFLPENLPVVYYIKPGYQPQEIKLDLEAPANTIKKIQAFQKSSKEL